MKNSNFYPIDLSFSILNVFDIGGTLPARKDGLPISLGLEYDMNRLQNDQAFIIEDYKKAAFKLRREMEEIVDEEK